MNLSILALSFTLKNECKSTANVQYEVIFTGLTEEYEEILLYSPRKSFMCTSFHTKRLAAAAILSEMVIADAYSKRR